MKILVTGANGFIGSHLTRELLRQRHEVSCLVRRISSERLDGLSVGRIPGDVTDRSTLAAVVAGRDVVYHLAGLVKAVHTDELYKVNGQGTGNIAWACAQQSTPPVLVIVSSLAAVGPSRPDHPHEESDMPAPVALWQEQTGRRVGVREYADRVPISIVRPSVVFGEGDPATWEIFRPIARLGLHLVPTYHDEYLSLIHVDDLVRLLILAATGGERIAAQPNSAAEAARGCYFAAAEKDMAYGDLGRTIGTALGRTRTRRHAHGAANGVDHRRPHHDLFTSLWQGVVFWPRQSPRGPRRIVDLFGRRSPKGVQFLRRRRTSRADRADGAMVSPAWLGVRIAGTYDPILVGHSERWNVILRDLTCSDA